MSSLSRGGSWGVRGEIRAPPLEDEADSDALLVYSSPSGKIWFDGDVGEEAIAKCSVCGLEQASAVCLDCKQGYCNECFAAMHSHPSRRDHRMQTSLSEGAATPTGVGVQAHSEQAAPESPSAPAQGQREAPQSNKKLVTPRSRRDSVEQEGEENAAKRAERAAAKRAQFLQKSGTDPVKKPPMDRVQREAAQQSQRKAPLSAKKAPPSSKKAPPSTKKASPSGRRDEKQSNPTVPTLQRKVKTLLAAASGLMELGDVDYARRMCLAAAREGFMDPQSLVRCAEVIRVLGDTEGADQLRDRADQRISAR